MSRFPLDLMPSFIQFLQKKYWINILTLNKEVYNNLQEYLVFEKSVFIIKPYILRLHACYLVRKTFVDRIKIDVEYRNRYLYIHRTEEPHFCWLQPPPTFLTIGGRLENTVRLLRHEAVRFDRLLDHFSPMHYNFLLKHVVIKDSKITFVNYGR